MPTRTDGGACRERHARDIAGVPNGTLGTLNVANVPFGASSVSRKWLSRRGRQHNVRDKLTARADDWDGFLANRIEEMVRVPPQVRESR